MSPRATLNTTLLSLARLLISGSVFFAPPVYATDKACENWPAWSSFKQNFISDGGRVIDRSLPEHVTTSEGQAYAMMFALIANDRAAFDLVLRWTENNLANGDLADNLPAWQWGRRASNRWEIIDDNTASDADLWIAYTLHEAGQLWQERKYTALAQHLSARILQEETADIPGLGLTLLPGRHGFKRDEKTWHLNPSYLPLPVLRRLATVYPHSAWHKIVTSSIKIITQSTTQGVAPDWVDYHTERGFQMIPNTSVEEIGFNAIRVYLWAGMMDQRDEAHPILLKNFAPLGQKIHAWDAATTDSIPAGFSAALLPFLKSSKLKHALRLQHQRVTMLAPLNQTENYYDQVLTLFGLGWLEGRYKFTQHGQLLPRWTCVKN